MKKVLKGFNEFLESEKPKADFMVIYAFAEAHEGHLCIIDDDLRTKALHVFLAKNGGVTRNEAEAMINPSAQIIKAFVAFCAIMSDVNNFDLLKLASE